MQTRKVGVLLGIGILLLPIVFSLFTLRKGYSVLVRIVALSWLAITLLVVFNNTESPKTTAQITHNTIPEYTVLSDESKRKIKRSVQVQLAERVDENVLSKIAKDLYQEGYERTFISYRLQGLPKDSGYWATTYFNPDLVVKIDGSTKQEYDKLLSLQFTVQGELIGKWLVHRYYDYQTAIYKNNDTFTHHTLYKDGSQDSEVLFTRKVDNQTRYASETQQEHNEYYVIADNGDLQFWSPNGNFYTAPSLPSTVKQ